MPADYLTLHNGQKILLNTPGEDAATKAGIALDADTYELDEAEFKNLRPYGDFIYSTPTGTTGKKSPT